MKRGSTFFALLALPAVVLTGCNPYEEGGAGGSYDTFSYTSYSDLPKTITLVDTRDNSVIWTYEVPVGRKLVISFFQDRFEDNPNRPDLMRWSEMSDSTRYGDLKSEMAVPRTRRIDMGLREPGESEPGAKVKAPGTTGAGKTKSDLY